MTAPSRFALAIVILALTACAAPAPYQADSRYLERDSPAQPRSAAAACPIAIASTQDDRRDRRVLGNVGGKTVFAPEDAQAWMRNVFAGLGQRGFDVRFMEADEAVPPGLHARPRLIHAWVSNIQTNKSANVVMGIEVLRDGATVLKRDYRGAVSGVNWAGSGDELQKMIDRAFGRMLDSLVVDLLPLCSPAGPLRSGN